VEASVVVVTYNRLSRYGGHYVLLAVLGEEVEGWRRALIMTSMF